MGLEDASGLSRKNFYAVEIFLRVDGHAGEDGVAGLKGVGARDDGVPLRFRQMQVDAAVLMLAELGL
ncbi:MAG: hypothetical protein WDM87_06070 [Terracidiphilus sp.]